MPFFTTFDGAADTAIGAPDFTLTSGGNFARLNGTGGAKALDCASATVAWHLRTEAGPNHFVEVVLGAGVTVKEASYIRLATVRADTDGMSGWHVTYDSEYELLLLHWGGSMETNANAILAAGDVLRLEAVGDTVRVKLNGITKITHAPLPAQGPANTRAGFRFEAFANTGEILRSWESGAMVAGADTDPPVLSAVSGAQTGATTASGSVTTTEAGPAWAVVTASATKPSAAQVKTGKDAAGANAAASATGTLSVGANAAKFAFTGLTSATAYYLHVVQDDTATVPNTSTVATSPQFTTAAAPPVTLSLNNPATDVLGNNTGTVTYTNQPYTAFITNEATGAVVATKTGTTSAAGLIGVLTDPGLVAGTAYAIRIRVSATNQPGLAIRTAVQA